MSTVRTEQEIKDLHLEALEATAAQGMRAADPAPDKLDGYQQGVADALDWLTGNTDDRPDLSGWDDSEVCGACGGVAAEFVCDQCSATYCQCGPSCDCESGN